MMCRGKGKSPERGLTLLDMAVGTSIFALLIGSAVTAARQGREAVKSASVNASVEAKVRRGLDRIARELVGVAGGSLTPAPDPFFGTDSLEFSEVASVVNGVPVLGPSQLIEFRYDNGELDDGIDNDGDGLIDEGRVVLDRDVDDDDEPVIVLCRNVRELLEGEEADGDDTNGNGVIDESGFNVFRDGDVLTLRLTVEEPSDDVGTIARTLTTAVRLRN